MSGCRVYYKAFQERAKPALHCIHVDVECYEEARDAVLAQLHATREVFYKPVLVVIQGGKK